MLIQTRRYVDPDEILELDSTLLGPLGVCQLWVRAPGGEHAFAVAADLADVAGLLPW